MLLGKISHHHAKERKNENTEGEKSEESRYTTKFSDKIVSILS